MKTLEIYKYTDYREYLRQEFAGTGAYRGRRSELAEFLGCQTSYISQILTDRGQMNLEQGMKTADFLGLTSLERDYFMLLLQKARAGSKDLIAYFDEKISQILKKRNDVKERINIKSNLSPIDEMTYYSAWYFSAIHVLTAFDDYKRAEQIADHLKIELSTTKKALAFLEDRGFVKKLADGYHIGSTRIHLGKGAKMLPKHHINWRMRAIEKVDHVREHELHYSAVLGISRKDTRAFKERLLQVLQEFEPVIERSAIEEPVVLLMDLFSF